MSEAGAAQARRTRVVRRGCRRAVSRALVPLDTEAVRAAYLAACEEDISELEMIERSVREYAQDERAYVRWLRLALGPQYAALREAMEAYEAAYVAYRRAQARSGRAPSLAEALCDALGVSDWWENSGMHTDGMGSGVGGAREEQAAARIERMEHDAALAGVEYEDVEARIKELYRSLCRKLHPDAGGSVPAGLDWLWEEVHEAYRAGDVSALYHLETRVMIMQGTYRSLTRVSDILAFHERVRAVLRTLEERVGMLSESAAWGFREWSAAKRQRMLRQAQREIEMEIANLEELAAFYEEGLTLMEAMRAVEQCAREPIVGTAKPTAPPHADTGEKARVQRRKNEHMRVRRTRIKEAKRP